MLHTAPPPTRLSPSLAPIVAAFSVLSSTLVAFYFPSALPQVRLSPPELWRATLERYAIPLAAISRWIQSAVLILFVLSPDTSFHVPTLAVALMAATVWLERDVRQHRRMREAVR